MSDEIKHECGIALLRLRKPLQYYIDKYGTPLYAVNKMALLMNKQANRGQDGAGIANIKLNVAPGYRFISRYRSVEAKPIEDIFEKINKKYRKAEKEDSKKYLNAEWLQENYGFTGEVWMGHLRYGTHGKNEIENCHPFLRQNNWRSRNLVVAGNFNMTNVDELFDKLVSLGQHPKDKVDTVTVMEKIGHFLDEEVQRQFDRFKPLFPEDNQQLTSLIEENIDVARMLQRSCRDFDGGYTMCGMLGSGAAFVARDPAGIRPAYYYADDEVIVVASEKPAIKMSFNCDYDEIAEIGPGNALIIDTNGEYREEQFRDPLEKKSCSFERIYFSRASDPDIYRERKNLGKLVLPQILKEIDNDLANTVFSYIPNTAETAFFGLVEGLDEHLVKERKKHIREGVLFEEDLDRLLSFRPRTEKIISKDVKLRTFITNDTHRDEMVSNVYETTFEVIKKKEDTIVLIDDSIVRGTTLERSILRMLDRLEPKKIVIVSSAPQIRYPDCYGIDMSKMKDFVAFRAVLKLLEEENREELLEETLARCKDALENGYATQENYVKALYEPFTDEQISKKIAEIVTPKNCQAEVSIIYQTVDDLHKACPNHTGDWYFTGNYPTPGGNKVVNRAFVNYMIGKGNERAYGAF
ncbi:amidophosphoribosyltransferase [Siphonobacter sp. BAB-5385]|uniref:Amidophosphoribosyltransferase n=1 Tax=Siphonobacter curvatus TaxID=2094562 RepID=A0A2S7IM13_9BACT|nr:MULTISPECIES: class II glutamine amidotransferase [Siphonobacter]OZI06654.1 amidophosphoribosyltransferase [Siphonobacter sp. BAB-5385]PMD96428.1 amidophosphoribosyltransferase [Siphonobacter sp. BAB-5405]PQA58689.1 amidophosphoribosyltransferase [Siphonobacter curvatus]